MQNEFMYESSIDSDSASLADEHDRDDPDWELGVEASTASRGTGRQGATSVQATPTVCKPSPRGNCRRSMASEQSGGTSRTHKATATRSAGSGRRGGGRGAMTRKERLLMRPWLQQQADLSRIPNMFWYDAERTMIRIPWKHGSRSGWTLDDCCLYRAWAEHTGKCTGNVDEPKRWKANFRCALNSLPDVREVKSLGQTRGKDPFKVYQFLSESPRRCPTKRSRRSRKDRGSAIKADPELSTQPVFTELKSEPVSPTADFTTTLLFDHSYLSLDPISETVVPFDIPFRCEGSSTSPRGVIPTVVEDLQMEDQEQDFMIMDAETLSAVKNLNAGSCSPVSSGYGSQFLDDVDTLETVGLLPEWCNDDHCPVENDLFLQSI